ASATSLSAVEKTGESATAEAPQTPSSRIITGQLELKNSGETRQHIPLIIMATPEARPLPKRPDAHPPIKPPTPPAIPMVRNEAIPAVASFAEVAATKKSGSHVHSA